ncbi:LCP family protein, partial [Streptomyces luteocolor]|uniref:LCP family protein n=1 Tax=Streptomyces luteocolor TaxID=285500 RepID=UPI000852BE91
GWVYVKLNGSIQTFSADGVSGDRPAAGGSGAQNVLVIGSDARTGGNEDLGGGDPGDVGRSDTAFLLHVYADQRHAVAVSIPRDALVDIPPCKLPDGKWTELQRHVMFNSAYSVGETAQGNPACTQNTVEKLSGLRVDHTVVVDFKGFSELTDVVGGVQVCLPKDVYQKDLNPNRGDRGKRIFSKGVQEVSGQRALDYVRIRHGIGDGSDIGRIKRQQAFVGALLKKIKGEGLSPGKLFPLADAAVQSMTVDPGLGSADKLISFAMSLKDIDLSNTKFVTLPWRYDGPRVDVVEPDASELWAALKEDRPLGKENPGQGGGGGASVGRGISVGVLNGTSVDGLAADASEALSSHGFTVTRTATADRQDHATTVVEYGPGAGQKARAEAVARVLPGARVHA